jgi:hypothetical protein
VARQRQRRKLSFLELNLVLTTTAQHGDKPVTRWSTAKAMARAWTTAGRVGEFIGMWAITKYQLGEVTTEIVAERWGLNERTAYRRLDEFRSVWGPPALTKQLDTPDPVADVLIAEFRRRREKLGRSMLGKLAGEEFELPADLLPAT